jgi:DNA polymerase-3 subunit alpha
MRAPGEVLIQVNAGQFGATLIEELKTIFEHFPGDAEVLLEMETRQGLRRLRFGGEYRVRPSAALDAELDALLGTAARAA